MTVTWKPSPFLLVLILWAKGEVFGQFQLQPESAVALQGSDVRFKATVKGDWPFMTWSMGEFLVLTVNSETGYTSTSKRYTAANCSSGGTSCWELTIHGVSRNDSGAVICAVQGPYVTKTAQLAVQEAGTVKVLGGNRSATQGESVAVQCVMSAWFPAPAVSWMLQGTAVNASLFDTTVQADQSWFNATSVLNFHAATDTTVECRATVLALESPLFSSVNVVVVPKPTDWTVLIAVVVSIGGLALLVLLILCIIFCCKRRKEKESHYQDELRGAQRQLGDVYAETNSQTSVVPSAYNNSGFILGNGSTASEILGVRRPVQTSHTEVYGPVYKNHRHATIV